MSDNENMTVAEATALLVRRVESGSNCPCCGQFAKAYKRRIRGNHTRFLVDVARLATVEDPWVHYSKCFFAGRDYAYLRHFGLAETREREGLWKITPHGERFLLGEEGAGVPEWILVFNNAVVARAEKIMSARDCLAQGGFDYDDLMHGSGS
jgi:hypothetical protein